MSDTLSIMSKPKSRQVRIPNDILDDVRIVASHFHETPADYVARILRIAIKRDLKSAQKDLGERIKRADDD